jgi:hypothetical protein
MSQKPAEDAPQESKSNPRKRKPARTPPNNDVRRRIPADSEWMVQRFDRTEVID